MDISYVVYGLAVGWFTYHMFWMAMRIYQFSAFPRTYGTTPDLSLHDLGEAAVAEQRELPAFRVVIPAFQEVDVIEATLRRAAAMNYPRSHFEVDVVTYEDEPPTPEGLTTCDVATRVGDEINGAAGVELVRVVRVPAGYDGFFPGNLDAPARHIGKARGLNFAIRSLHERHERSERALYIGLMGRLGHRQRIDASLASLASQHGNAMCRLAYALFDPGSPEHLGPLALSTQLMMVAELAEAVRASGGGEASRAWARLAAYVDREAPRFFLESRRVEGSGALVLDVVADKQFLFDVMRHVEGRSVHDVDEELDRGLRQLGRTRPLLHTALQGARAPEDIFQLTRRVNTRWMMVYDADADPPPDVMRHLALRILLEPDVMGFQGPIAPLLNYEDVHPLCRMGALWMAFWHGAAYPRLLHNSRWAHPLAGTNWCFRIDGFERDGRLIRHCSYDESKRRFLLHFDPMQLTEDLEAGVRNFSEWSINAEWHPLVEMEQVPPTPGTMFRQHARWALGTLQTMSYVVHSNLPWTQKSWFLMYPLRVIFASSGPFVTVALLVAVAGHVLKVAPIFAWWTLALAFGNLIYVCAFVRTFERYHDMHRRAVAVDYILHNGPALLRQACSGGAQVDAAIEQVRRRLRQGMRPGGFVQRYLESRCTDNATDGDRSAAVVEYVAHLRSETPAVVHSDAVERFVRELESAIETRPVTLGQARGGTASDWVRLAALLEAAATSAGVGRRLRWSRFHTQILLWSIPFVYFSVTPFFNAFWRWSRRQCGGWNKTVRTPKSWATRMTGETR